MAVETDADRLNKTFARWNKQHAKPKPSAPALAVDNTTDGEQQTNGRLVLRLARLQEPASLAPREWLYGTQLIRGFVTVLVAPGGTGKSAYAMAVALSIASNRSFLFDHIFLPTKVAYINLDDPMDELDRRIAAIRIAHKISKDELENRVFLEDCDGHGLTVASPVRDDDGFYVATPDEEQLIALIKQHEIGLIVCDPFAESHTMEENSNPQMVHAAGVWRRIARATNCAVLLVHHVRKGDITSIDAARGAKAVTDSARVGLLMTTMTEAEAEEFGISEDDRNSYIRLDDAKRNMAVAAKAKWFRLLSVKLGNRSDTYPKGDNVGAIVSWQPPDNELDTAPNSELNAALDAIKAGPSPGILYTTSRRGQSSDRWCGNVLCEMFSVGEKQATKMVNAWLKSGLLHVVKYRHPKFYKDVPGVAVNDAQRPT